MGISTPFIERPVATTLLTAALAMSGAIAYNFLPVAPLPQVDFPAISVGAGCPARVPKPWRPRWRRRSSASSDASPA